EKPPPYPAYWSVKRRIKEKTGYLVTLSKRTYKISTKSWRELNKGNTFGAASSLETVQRPLDDDLITADYS
ncbi:13371_t:CDS:2, partial [Dentiscutata erythropus]